MDRFVHLHYRWPFDALTMPFTRVNAPLADTDVHNAGGQGPMHHKHTVAIATTLTAALALPAPALSASGADSLLSGYGSPGAGESTVLPAPGGTPAGSAAASAASPAALTLSAAGIASGAKVAGRGSPTGAKGTAAPTGNPGVAVGTASAGITTRGTDAVDRAAAGSPAGSLVGGSTILIALAAAAALGGFVVFTRGDRGQG